MLKVTELLIKGYVMKGTWLFSAVLIITLAGCQQSEQSQNSGISRRDRLLANENMNIRNELTDCQKEVKRQQELLTQCQQEKEEIGQQANENVSWLMEELPGDLQKEINRLTKENEQLKAEIVSLGGQLP
ncbi:MAG: hypothetical protein JW806_10485 [Sedimentisphaerales bacterium]|nr:hypothetical protein [Sedimentisphaerales bacterium]